MHATLDRLASGSTAADADTMSPTPADTWNARLPLLADGLAEDRRAGFPLGAADIDGWLRRIGIGWDTFISWVIEKALDDAEAVACATPDGRLLLGWLYRIQRTVPQMTELLLALDIAAELHSQEDYREGVLERLRREFQAAADQGANPRAIVALLRLWERTTGARVNFEMRGNTATIEVEIQV